MDRGPRRFRLKRVALVALATSTSAACGSTAPRGETTPLHPRGRTTPTLTLAALEPAPDPVESPPYCSNGALDGDETDVDCGGGTCPACADGRACIDGAQDCTSSVCARAVCRSSPSAKATAPPPTSSAARRPARAPSIADNELLYRK